MHKRASKHRALFYPKWLDSCFNQLNLMRDAMILWVKLTIGLQIPFYRFRFCVRQWENSFFLHEENRFSRTSSNLATGKLLISFPEFTRNVEVREPEVDSRVMLIVMRGKDLVHCLDYAGENVDLSSWFRSLISWLKSKPNHWSVYKYLQNT